MVRRWVAHLCCWDGLGHIKHPLREKGKCFFPQSEELGQGGESFGRQGEEGRQPKRQELGALIAGGPIRRNWLRTTLLTIRNRPGGNQKTLYWEYSVFFFFFPTSEKSRNGSARKQCWQTGLVLFVIRCRRCHVTILKVYLLLAIFFLSYIKTLLWQFKSSSKFTSVNIVMQQHTRRQPDPSSVIFGSAVKSC